jgi:hypothetical protein
LPGYVDLERVDIPIDRCSEKAHFESFSIATSLNVEKGVPIHFAHHCCLLHPIFLPAMASLLYTQGIDPKVSNTQLSGNVYRITECGSKNGRIDVLAPLA